MERNFEWQNKADIKSLTLSELTEQLVALGQPKFRGKQIYSWLHEKRVKSFDEMTNPVSYTHLTLPTICSV